ncbi:MAG: hypothetical protein JKY15_06355 [Deltaproteobacteria bacterium]|nr:hypothetical protein [Deltaproteobacteria bacterium]
MKEKLLAILSLFASASTLICCALPILFVTLGFGAAIAGLVSVFPWLVDLTANKEWLFLGVGALIDVNWIWLWYQKHHAVACVLPSKRGETATACDTASRFSRILLWISIGIYATGFLAAFLAYPISRALGFL